MSDEYPGPWRWDVDVLFDGNGEPITQVEHPFPPRVRALTEAAPEMLELIRNIQWGPEMGRDSERHCQDCGCPESEPHMSGCEIAALLARIDGGT